ncbi:MAG: SIS domain-containing protein [Planctomycetia bacterium]|nr:SIS domain-containing protein [Planctomycetia bacterium]
MVGDGVASCNQSQAEDEDDMNLTEAKCKDFALVKEMLQTCEIIRRFDFAQADEVARVIQETGRLFLTGEGSSRIFPAKSMMCELMRMGAPLAVATDGARQAHEYNLADYAVFAASNSGQTKEVISLFAKLVDEGHPKRFGLTANTGTRLEAAANRCYVLSCGKEEAVAATKSVVEQALFYRSLLRPFAPGECPMVKNQRQAADAARATLEMRLDPAIVETIAGASAVYFAGRNDGVAEELTLKTNEITRKKSDYLEGTYAVHGIEEVMEAGDVVLVVDPFPAEVEKFKETLAGGVGMSVIAIAAEETIFPTIKIPTVEGYDAVLELLAGWNVLVSVGVANGVNLDKPARARKIGNEFVG